MAVEQPPCPQVMNECHVFREGEGEKDEEGRIWLLRCCPHDAQAQTSGSLYSAICGTRVWTHPWVCPAVFLLFNHSNTYVPVCWYSYSNFWYLYFPFFHFIMHRLSISFTFLKQNRWENRREGSHVPLFPFIQTPFITAQPAYILPQTHKNLCLDPQAAKGIKPKHTISCHQHTNEQTQCQQEMGLANIYMIYFISFQLYGPLFLKWSLEIKEQKGFFFFYVDSFECCHQQWLRFHMVHYGRREGQTQVPRQRSYKVKCMPASRLILRFS